MRLYDAHNHWQDERLDAHRDQAIAEARSVGLVKAVVAGSGVHDWPAVAALAHRHDCVLPSFGVHPWYVHEQPEDWAQTLLGYLQSNPHAAVGEIGLDRWIRDPNLPLQQSMFLRQLGIARELHRPATIHCLRAWGLLDELLRQTAWQGGFLLHSYGGPAEMIPGFAKMGAYFSISPYFFHPRKAQQLEVFRRVPRDRLLIETDAPDMWPPADLNQRPLQTAAGDEINHPANLDLVLHGLAGLLEVAEEALAEQLEANFHGLFG
jgi:TatD DNase family protein